MDIQITEGTRLTLDSAHGPISRVAVKMLGKVVRVCRSEEYELAKKEGRQPVTVGFMLADILTIDA
jgi:hypothetical protein